MPESKFKEDMAAEKIMGEFLDEYFYPQVLKSGKTIERVCDKERQRKGIDVIVFSENHRFNIDEKAQLDYIGNPLPTFAFELLSHITENGKREKRIGWFINDSLETDFYFLIWVCAAKSITLKSKDDILKLETMLISKRVLRDFLAKSGFDGVTLSQKAEELDCCGACGPFGKEKNSRIYYYKTSSSDKNEGPINLVINKSVLKKAATHCYTIEKADGAFRINCIDNPKTS